MESIDLNLMRVLDAVLDTGSVTAAAERLHLSVPATSHALARLRDALGDPLLVRAGRRMVPTPRAVEMREPLSQWLAQGRLLLARDRSQALSTLRRCFVVRAPEGMAISFGASLVQSLREILPLATLRFVTETTTEDTALRDGTLDLDIGHFVPREPEVHTLHLMQQRPMALVRAGHPLTEHKVTAKRLCEHLHVDVQRRPGAPSPLDDALAAQQQKRPVVLTVPQAQVAALVAGRSDLVATLNERIARAMAPVMNLQVLSLAFAVGTEPLVMAWHPRHHADPAHTALRQSLLKLLALAWPGASPSPRASRRG
ncbi:LysR family transcriptional regulator [Piscinibacter sakaiensis]|uniref:Transcriptional regulator, LysR family n=1 Tax=Piscinibacter sakaiensis TaxID=1547922 RepID=A0A0K8P7E7_PISS1|nr:LysR family transcriptional regulator [Piscinibacter sakaiensis]GAP38552.1 transcriptional regulator, LysR family [Piscinibacter sakaiensis]